jgi:DNA sulfur modification protein DndE
MKKLSLMMLLSVATVLTGADIFLAGDSTCASYKAERAPLTGWGQLLPQFCTADVKVVNSAMSGTSTKSFRDVGFWDKMIARVKAGDFVVIQFGHNNRSKDPKRGTTMEQFSLDITKFVQEVKAKGASAILVTPIQERKFAKGEFVGGKDLPEYARRIREIAATEKIPVIDLNEATKAWIAALGDADSKAFYMSGTGIKERERDDTHVTDKGALAIAEMFVKDAKAQNLPIARCFK